MSVQKTGKMLWIAGNLITKDYLIYTKIEVKHIALNTNDVILNPRKELMSYVKESILRSQIRNHFHFQQRKIQPNSFRTV